MLTADETWQALRTGPIYADFEAKVPTRVWVVEHEVFAGHRAVEVKPFEEIDGLKGLVWALVEAMSVSRSRYGISVTFWKGGATGWFPYGNARLPVQPSPGSC